MFQSHTQLASQSARYAEHKLQGCEQHAHMITLLHTCMCRWGTYFGAFAGTWTPFNIWWKMCFLLRLLLMSGHGLFIQAEQKSLYSSSKPWKFTIHFPWPGFNLGRHLLPATVCSRYTVKHPSSTLHTHMALCLHIQVVMINLEWCCIFHYKLQQHLLMPVKQETQRNKHTYI